MRLPTRVLNSCLAVLLASSGYASLEEFATAVNHHGADSRGLRLHYNRSSVTRWLGGSVCEHPDVVAEVLSDAWGIPIPATVIWPESRGGAAPVPAHLQPWAARRTVDELALSVRKDLLVDASDFALAVRAVSGRELLRPIARWLGTEPGRLCVRAEAAGVPAVSHIERVTADLSMQAAAVGGGLCRYGAVGQLRSALDLIQRGGYDDGVLGNRLLAAVAELAGVVADLSHDAGLHGPAQAYAMYGLQAAHEATDDRGPLIAVDILVALAEQVSFAGEPDVALRLVDLAANHIPDRASHDHALRATLSSRRAGFLAATDAGRVSEILSAVDLSFALLAQPRDDRRPGRRRSIRGSIRAVFRAADVHSAAASTYLDLAAAGVDATDLATKAITTAYEALKQWPRAFTRQRAHDHTTIAIAQFLLARPAAACRSGEHAVGLASHAPGSELLKVRLRKLLAASDPYRTDRCVDRLRAHLL